MAAVLFWGMPSLGCSQTGPALAGLSSLRRKPESRDLRSVRFRFVRQAAEDDRETASEDQETPLPEAKEKTEATPKSKKKDDGEGTARITGAIAVLLGIAYLALVQVLERRGASLEPPPPEAYLP